MGLGFLLFGVALAGGTADEPLDPAYAIVNRLGRAKNSDLLYGARTDSALSMAYRWKRVGGELPEMDSVLAVELGHDGEGAWVLRPMARISVGTLEPNRQQGDVEPGLVSVRTRADTRAYWGPMEVMFAPELRADVDPGFEGELAIPIGWAGVHTDKLRVGFGLESRWFGPGRHGGLMLTDNARPAPLGSVAYEDRLGKRFGRFRAEWGMGWLDAERTDVQRPGWLVADLRWAPVSAVEIGATRVGIFGGKDRPAPELGQILLPTDPHVENDPEQKLPDQDEIAAFDARINLPVGQWLNGARSDAGMGFSLDYLEFYTQYGGEDVIARQLGPIPMPALAGIANLWGAEVGVGSLTFNGEWARVLDDQFRWYTGHRIYHQGLTQDGVVMGHPSGGDSRTWTMDIRWMPASWGLELSAEDRLLIGGIDVAQGRLRALSTDERTQLIGVRGWWMTDEKGWLHGGMELAKTTGLGFQPGASELSWRVFIGR